MKEERKVLQIGFNDWSIDFSPKHHNIFNWSFWDLSKGNDLMSQRFQEEMEQRTFDVVICTESVALSVLRRISPLIEAYGLIIDERLRKEVPDEVILTKCPVFLSFQDKNSVLETIQNFFFSGQMGSKLHVQTIAVAPNFKGKVHYSGQHRLMLEGDFSELDASTLLSWQYNISMGHRSKKIVLEFERSETIRELSMTILGIESGSSNVLSVWHYSEAELKQGIEVADCPGVAYLSLALSAKGYGQLEVGPLHYRDSRQDFGEYLLGGKKVSDEQNEELFYYFHPGDLKPPLNVYFSGYRSAEGFEGFYMMKQLGAPFLLITDPRLEGGSFYLGSETLEVALLRVIWDHLDRLGFSREQLVLSGLSMGTFGALYYGSFLSPHTIIVGKPLVNLGTIAENERLLRPGGFPTSLDILRSLTHELNITGISQLNRHFWDTFDEGEFENTQFMIAYMEDDDYDAKAYGELLEHLSGRANRVVSKGVPGRHNDNSPAINQWFIHHYQRLLKESFGRGGVP